MVCFLMEEEPVSIELVQVFTARRRDPCGHNLSKGVNCAFVFKIFYKIRKKFISLFYTDQITVKEML